MVGKYQTTARRQVEINKRYGRLLVKTFAGRNESGNLKWNCICSCGARKVVTTSNLLGGTCPSCGCYKQDILIQRNTIHGKSHLPEHGIWVGMRTRCSAPACSCWSGYGGRGIKVCKRWESFENFYLDMGPRPTSEHTLERVDNNGNYSPTNCIWATRKVQGRNKRNVPKFKCQGRECSVAEWAEITGIHPETLRKRVRRWGIQRAISAPIRPIRGVHY